MATCKDCKDCIHYELCGVFDYISPDECGFYTDRSRFVELPCKAEDTVYYIVSKNGEDKIKSAVVEGVAVYKSGTIGYDCGVGQISFSSKSIGKRVFLTQAEAEQAIKELIDNDKM